MKTCADFVVVVQVNRGPIGSALVGVQELAERRRTLESGSWPQLRTAHHTDAVACHREVVPRVGPCALPNARGLTCLCTRRGQVIDRARSGCATISGGAELPARVGL